MPAAPHEIKHKTCNRYLANTALTGTAQTRHKAKQPTLHRTLEGDHGITGGDLVVQSRHVSKYWDFETRRLWTTRSTPGNPWSRCCVVVWEKVPNSPILFLTRPNRGHNVQKPFFPVSVQTCLTKVTHCHLDRHRVRIINTRIQLVF
jgi:hypothetical protein